MKITKDIIDKLVDIITGGLENGTGDMLNTFCVQQAVSHACGQDAYGDHPTFCVDGIVVGFGIRINDRGWSSRQARAKGMRRFAVAELGSDKISGNEFMDRLTNKWHRAGHAGHPTDVYGDLQLNEVCEMAVQVLTEMGTEGSKYLYLTDPATPQFHKDMMQKIYKPLPIQQLTWRGFSAQSQEGHTRHLA